MSYQGKKNIYTCPKGHQTVTIDVDDGVTPFMLRCRQKDDNGKHNCTEMAKSCMYMLRPDQENLEPEYEWFRPDIKKVPKEMKEHVRMGGLDLRKCKK